MAAPGTTGYKNHVTTLLSGQGDDATRAFLANNVAVAGYGMCGGFHGAAGVVRLDCLR